LLDTQAASIDFKALKLAKKKQQEEEAERLAQEKAQKRLGKPKKRRKVVESEEEESTVDAHAPEKTSQDSDEDSSSSSDMTDVGTIETSGCSGLNMDVLRASISSRSSLLEPFAAEALVAQDLMDKRMSNHSSILPNLDSVPDLVKDQQIPPTSPSTALTETMQQMHIVVSGVPDVVQQIFDDSVSAGKNIDELWQEATGSPFTKESVEKQRKLLEPFSKESATLSAERSLYLAKVKKEKAVQPTFLPIKQEPEATLPRTFTYQTNSEGVILID
jgi:hypothetical protein